MASHFCTPEGTKTYGLRWMQARHNTLHPFVAPRLRPDSSDPAEEPIGYGGEATDPANAVQRPEVLVLQSSGRPTYACAG